MPSNSRIALRCSIIVQIMSLCYEILFGMTTYIAKFLLADVSNIVLRIYVRFSRDH